MPVTMPAPVRFRDVTEQAGICFTYHSGREASQYTILESVGGGVGIFDFDNDGTSDLYFTGGGEFTPEDRIMGVPGVLLRGVAPLRYEDVTAHARVAADYTYTHGCSVADYDNDGFADVLITGYGGLQLFHNQGDGTFLEVERSAGLLDDAWSTATGWGDVNGDGNLDLYVAHYVNWSFANNPICRTNSSAPRDVCPPAAFQQLPDLLYLSDGNGRFRDSSAESHLIPSGAGLGVVLVDLDDDGDLDIYVANDASPNFLYRNDGRGHFDEIGGISGTALDSFGRPTGSMGVDVSDYDGNGQLDIGVANFQGDNFALYRQTNGQFVDVSTGSGLAALGTSYVEWGTVFADFDNDGDEDLIVSTGHVFYHLKNAMRLQKPLLLINNAGRFHKALADEDSYFSQPHLGRGLACGDLDGDGDLDVVFANCDEPAALLVNDPPKPGASLSVRLVGTSSNRDAIGAKLVLQTTAGEIVRHIKGGGSYLSQNSLVVHFGLVPGSRIKSLEIRWPSGIEQKVAPLPEEQVALIAEPMAPTTPHD